MNLRRAALLAGLTGAAYVGLSQDEADAALMGRLARQMNKQAGRLAQRMRRQGASNDDIWRATQTQYGQGHYFDEGQHTWETPTDDWTLEPAPTERSARGPLRRFAQSETVRANYPDLLNIRTEMGATPTLGHPTDRNDRGRYLGYLMRARFPWERRRMAIAAGGNRRGTVAHEVQHAIDDEEGMPFDHEPAYLDRRHERRAMNVEYRLGMSPLDRSLRPPWTTEADAVRNSQSARRVQAAADAANAPPKPERDYNLEWWWGSRGRYGDQRQSERSKRNVNMGPGHRYVLGTRGPWGRSYLSETEYARARRKDPDLPVIADDNMMDFDAPLRDQPPRVQEALRRLMDDEGWGERNLYYRGRSVGHTGGENDQRLSYALEREGLGPEEHDLLIRALEEHGTTPEGRRAGLAALEKWSQEYAGQPLSARQRQLAETVMRRYSDDPNDAFGSAIYDIINSRNPYIQGNPNWRDTAQLLHEAGIVGGYYRGGEGLDPGRSLLMFHPNGHEVTRASNGRFYAIPAAIGGAEAIRRALEERDRVEG